MCLHYKGEEDRGTCESRNAERGTERGTEVKMWAARYHHRTRRASLFTGLVDWTGLTQKSVRCLFQCRTEAKHTYLFTKVACIACFRVFPRVGRGQRSRAYLMSFNEKLEEHLFTADIELQPFAEA